MKCPDCDSPVVSFTVPTDLRDYVDGEPRMAICSVCLRLHTADQGSDLETDTDFTDIDETFPTGEAAIPMALALGLLDSLALNRSEVEALIEHAEAAGADPFLVMDRLATAEVRPPYGMERRRNQLEQLLG